MCTNTLQFPIDKDLIIAINVNIERQWKAFTLLHI